MRGSQRVRDSLKIAPGLSLRPERTTGLVPSQLPHPRGRKIALSPPMLLQAALYGLTRPG